MHPDDAAHGGDPAAPMIPAGSPGLPAMDMSKNCSANCRWVVPA
jgi:hypothetical protein